MKCALIGAAGYIGQHLGRALVERGHDARGFDHVEPPAGEFPIEACDVATEAPAIAPGTDAVVYLAQSPHFRPGSAKLDELFGVSVVGAIRAAQAAADAGARIFLNASTGTVYAPSFDALSEASAVRRDTAYALSKVAGEEALRLLADRIAITSVRFFGVFGPGQKGRLVDAIAERIRDGRPVTLAPHPRHEAREEGMRISLTSVTDLSDMLVRLLDCAALPPLLNVAASRAVSVRDVAEMLGRAIGRTPSYEPAPEPREMDYIADVGLLASLIELRETPLDAALAEVIAVHA